METDILDKFRSAADPEKAKEMSAYMRDQFAFLGIPSPVRKEMSKEFLKTAKKKPVDWAFVFECWERPEREYQYLAANYLEAVKRSLFPSDIPNIKKLIASRSWWDTVDSLDVLVGDIALRYPEVNETILMWSIDENMWLRRTAIDHQLTRRDKTDTALLEKILLNNLGQDEFFVNKAIGWSLREYSKTNPDWVRSFIEKHKNDMKSLSIREGSKYL